LYFEGIHPFEDGNGRIGRALADKALGQGTSGGVLYGLSHAIEADKKFYYDALEKAQRSLDLKDWIAYFVKLVLQAQENAEGVIGYILKKVAFLDRFRGQLEPRQERVVIRMLDAGPDGFEGGINARKYGALTKVSKATATRDLQSLAKMGALVPEGGGRSVRYQLALYLFLGEGVFAAVEFYHAGAHVVVGARDESEFLIQGFDAFGGHESDKGVVGCVLIEVVHSQRKEFSADALVAEGLGHHEVLDVEADAAVADDADGTGDLAVDAFGEDDETVIECGGGVFGARVAPGAFFAEEDVFFGSEHA